MTDSANNDSPGVTVHLIFSVAGFAAALARGRATDIWVLIGDGVYALATDNDDYEQPALCYVLAADLAQRGVRVPKSAQSVDLIDDLALVDIISAGHHAVSWR